MACKEKNGKWKARWSLNGKRFSKSGFSTKAYAETYEAQQRVKIEKGLLGVETQEEIEINFIFKKYLDYARKYKKGSLCYILKVLFINTKKTYSKSSCTS